VEGEVQNLCTSTNLEDIVVVADLHMDVWRVCHIHSAHTRIGFVHIYALLVFSNHFNGPGRAIGRSGVYACLSWCPNNNFGTK